MASRIPSRERRASGFRSPDYRNLAAGGLRPFTRSIALWLAALCLMSTSGCVAGSLASSTGPRQAGARWSAARRQYVHVGERVEFDFVLTDAFGRRIDPRGRADYLVVSIGTHKLQAGPDLSGHFTFSHTFSETSPGERVDVTASAFLQNGARDYVAVQDRWEHVDSAYDQPDRRVAGAAIALTAYEASILMELVRPPDDLDETTGILTIRRADGKAASVFCDRPNRPGFTLTEPGPAGMYKIGYAPRASQLNATGTTEVALTIYDIAGQTHTVTQTLETP